MARVSLALAAGAAAVASAQNLARTVLLTEYVNTTGARCLDGTPQRYWIQSAQGANSTKWVFGEQQPLPVTMPPRRLHA